MGGRTEGKAKPGGGKKERKKRRKRLEKEAEGGWKVAWPALLLLHVCSHECWRPRFTKETGLDWTGLDWTGLDWTGLDWTALHCTGLDWTRFDLSRLDSTQQGGKLF